MGLPSVSLPYSVHGHQDPTGLQYCTKKDKGRIDLVRLLTSDNASAACGAHEPDNPCSLNVGSRCPPNVWHANRFYEHSPTLRFDCPRPNQNRKNHADSDSKQNCQTRLRQINFHLSPLNGCSHY